VNSSELEIAIRHIEEGRARIRRHQELIASLANRGLPTELAMTILDSMQDVLRQMESHKQYIEGYAKNPPPRMRHSPGRTSLAPTERIRSGVMAAIESDETKYWRNRAQHIRALLVSIKNPDSRLVMVKIAEDYEKLARRAEQRLRSRIRMGAG
jgi:hypothetical protein